MRKKFILVLFSAIAVVCLVCGFTACSPDKKKQDNDSNVDASDSGYQTDDDFDDSELYANPGIEGDYGLNFRLSSTGDYYSVTGMKEEYEFVNIPSIYNGLSVTAIAPNAFEESAVIKKIVIPEGVTSIGEFAFYDCVSLTSIIIPDSVTSIGNYAFSTCLSLVTVTIGDRLVSIGANAFSDCTSLLDIVVPDNVTFIGDGAFSGCSSLSSITLPFIGGNAESSSASDSTLFGYIFGVYDYNGAVSTKQYYASGSFVTYYIPSTLTSVTITGGNILYGAFYNCSSLLSVTITVHLTLIGYSAFAYCSSLTSIVIPKGVTTIDDYAFSNCTSLTSIAIPDTVTSIGIFSFEKCSSLISITIPERVASIGRRAFFSCTALTEINFNAVAMSDLNSSNGIFYWAGRSNSGITLTIGSRVTKIPTSLFNPAGGVAYYTPYIVTVIFADNSQCTSIGDYAFYYCDSITSVYYSGSFSDWSKISIGTGNNYITTVATIYYYSEIKPTEEGNFWHYVDDEIVVWVKEDN